MLRVLRQLRSGPECAYRLKCGIETLCALERRKLVRVETTFGSIAFPRNALAYITEAGRVASFQLKPAPKQPQGDDR